jgi:hypothetical protein
MPELHVLFLAAYMFAGCCTLYVRGPCRGICLHRTDGAVRCRSGNYATHGVGAGHLGRQLHVIPLPAGGFVSLVDAVALPGGVLPFAFACEKVFGLDQQSFKPDFWCLSNFWPLHA